MPTYEYRCPKGHEFELFQRMSDEPRAECPTCGAEAERLLSGGAGFLFKGEGFYITDYRSDSYKEAAKKEKKGGDGGGDGGSGSSPAKKEGDSRSSGTKEKSSGKKDKPSGGASDSSSKSSGAD